MTDYKYTMNDDGCWLMMISSSQGFRWQRAQSYDIPGSLTHYCLHLRDNPLSVTDMFSGLSWAKTLGCWERRWSLQSFSLADQYAVWISQQRNTSSWGLTTCNLPELLHVTDWLWRVNHLLCPQFDPNVWQIALPVLRVSVTAVLLY